MKIAYSLVASAFALLAAAAPSNVPNDGYGQQPESSLGIDATDAGSGSARVHTVFQTTTVTSFTATVIETAPVVEVTTTVQPAQYPCEKSLYSEASAVTGKSFEQSQSGPSTSSPSWAWASTSTTAAESSSASSQSANTKGPSSGHSSRDAASSVYSASSQANSIISESSRAPETAPTTTQTQVRHSNATQTSAAPAVTSCGESGNFTLTWDDEPTFTPSKNDSEVMFPPVFNPYHHLFFASGYSYLQDIYEPFPATSNPNLAVWLANNSNTDTGSPSAGLPILRPGEIGAGPRAAFDAYWINAYEAYFGCLSSGPSACELTVTGYTWDGAKKAEIPRASFNTSVPVCPGFKNCKLQRVAFTGPDFEGLSGLQFQMYEGTVPQDFVIDSLAMSWWNNTCAAGLLRITQRK